MHGKTPIIHRATSFVEARRLTNAPIPRLGDCHLPPSDEPVETRILNRTAKDNDIENVAGNFMSHENDRARLSHDPVARFHLGNGAFIHEVHSKAELTPKGHHQAN